MYRYIQIDLFFIVLFPISLAFSKAFLKDKEITISIDFGSLWYVRFWMGKFAFPVSEFKVNLVLETTWAFSTLREEGDSFW